MTQVQSLDPAETIVWATRSVRALVAGALPFRIWTGEEPPDVESGTLIAIGGGTLLDRAKVAASERRLTLVAIPSIWGSGAEGSPIVVLQRGAAKEIRMDERYVPHARAVWPELAESVPEGRAREACGDAWSHALEGFLSPIAEETLRREGAGLIREMLDVGIARDRRWFELSARACALQARSSVGLIHGFAHVLEGPLRARFGEEWGHARLCSIFFRPVLEFDARSETVTKRLADHGIDPDSLRRTGDALFEEDRFRQAMELLPEQWPAVLRDRCTRTNSVLVRPGDFAFFEEFAP